MPTTKRRALGLIVATALPLLALGEAVAGGGFFPNFPPEVGLTALKTSGQVTAVIVLDIGAGLIGAGRVVVQNGNLAAAEVEDAALPRMAAVSRLVAVQRASPHGGLRDASIGRCCDRRPNGGSGLHEQPILQSDLARRAPRRPTAHGPAELIFPRRQILKAIAPAHISAGGSGRRASPVPQ